MAFWNVKTTEKKSAEEHELWQKDDQVIRVVNGFRWGEFVVETTNDNPPELDQTDGPGADAVDMYSPYSDNIESTELVSLDDGWYGDIIWPDDMDDEERDRLQEIYDEDSYGWEEEGWSQYESECWFSGPLEITKDES